MTRTDTGAAPEASAAQVESARAATSRLTPEEALDQADRKVRAIFHNWRERGKV